MNIFRNFTNRTAQDELFHKTQLSKFSIRFSQYIGLVFSALLTLVFANGGLNITYKVIGLVVMAGAGFFAGVLLMHLVALWFLTKKRAMNLYEGEPKNSVTTNLEDENTQIKMMKKSKFLKIKWTGIVFSLFTLLVCSVMGFITTYRELGLLLMAVAGFFGFILLISLVAKGFRVQPHYNH